MHYGVNLLNTIGTCIRSSKMLLSRQGRMKSCAKLNYQPNIKLKIAIQVPKMYPLFRVLSATTTAFET